MIAFVASATCCGVAFPSAFTASPAATASWTALSSESAGFNSPSAFALSIAACNSVLSTLATKPASASFNACVAAWISSTVLFAGSSTID